MRSRLIPILALVLAACGAEEPAAKKHGGSSRGPLPVVEPVPLEERARFALRCLMRGPPRNAGLLGASDIHTWNLELAMRDLTALEPQALKLLEDDDLRRRTVANVRAAADPWINVLRVLQNTSACPPELALRWTEPALDTADRQDLGPLRLEAIRLLTLVRDARAPALLYRFFEAEPHLRDVAAFALKGLFEAGSPWRAKAVDVVLRRAGPTIWEQVHNRLGALVKPGSADSGVADLAAWWSVLTDGSGPRLPARLPRVKTAPWGPARLWLDPSIPRAQEGDADAPLRPAYGPVPSSVVRGAGWYATDLTNEALFPAHGYTVTGKLPSADARCVLARWHYPAYVASVKHDLATEVGEERDAGLYFVALHCMLDPGAEDTGGSVKSKLRALLDRPGEASMSRSQEIQRLVQALPPAEDDPESFALLLRVVREVRPLDLYRLPIELAYDGLSVRPDEQLAVIEGFLANGASDRASLGVALSLIQRARSAAHVPALEAFLAANEDPRMQAVIKRMLIYIYSAGDAEPRQLEAFVRRLRGWLADADDAALAATAGTLLDFGDAGIEAFREGLLGPRRAAYLRAWPGGNRPMALPIVEAVVTPISRDSPDAEVRRVLRLAYRSFPDEAAPYVVLLRRRAHTRFEKAVDAVLERVRHRAPGR